MLTETLLKSLLKDYISFTRLFNCLENAGLETDAFIFNLGTTILQIMELDGGESGDIVFSELMETAEKITSFHSIEWQGKVEALANETYNLLTSWQNAKTI